MLVCVTVDQSKGKMQEQSYDVLIDAVYFKKEKGPSNILGD
jgi:hypothetical protein